MTREDFEQWTETLQMIIGTIERRCQSLGCLAPEAVEELAEVHTTAIRKACDRIDEAARKRDG